MDRKSDNRMPLKEEFSPLEQQQLAAAASPVESCRAVPMISQRFVFSRISTRGGPIDCSTTNKKKEKEREKFRKCRLSFVARWMG